MVLAWPQGGQGDPCVPSLMAAGLPGQGQEDRARPWPRGSLWWPAAHPVCPQPGWLGGLCDARRSCSGREPVRLCMSGCAA